MKRALLAALLATACATAPPTPPPPAEPVHVVLVGTTDVHGWFNGRMEVPAGGGEGVHHGGVALLASYVNALRAANDGNVVLVDSGDMFQGTLESNLFEGEPVVLAYNALGYSAAAVGNHEFDYGPLGKGVTASSPADDELGALKRNSGIAKFPFLAANMTERSTGKVPAWAKPYTMVEVKGAKIGIIGLATPDTPNVTIESNVRSLAFGDPVAATLSAAGELRAAGADAIVVIAHMGGRCTDLHDPRDASSCEERHEANRLLNSLPADTIDAYFAGHTHQQMRHFINGVPAAQSLAYSNEFSMIDLWIDTEANRVIDERSFIRPPTMICAVVYSGTERCDPRRAPEGSKLEQRVFEGRPIVRDTALHDVVEPYLAQVSAKKNERLGITASAPFTRVNFRESQLGNLLADAMREWAGADIGIMNSGGIRSNLRAGDLIYADIFEVSPFDNYPAVVQLTGQQIIDVLRATSGGDRGLMQVSGIRYTLDDSRDLDKKSGPRDRFVSATLANGEPLELEKLYSVVMPDFLVQGGDGFGRVMKAVPADRIRIDPDQPIRDIIIDALRKSGTPLVPKIEGRITILNQQQR
jgi:5'-nucleotidase